MTLVYFSCGAGFPACHLQRQAGKPAPRRGFSLIELTVAMALTIVVLGIVASLAVWSFRERAHHQARFIALETANNILEEARSLPWDKLTPGWAAAQPTIDDLFLPEGKIAVTVTDEPGEKGLKRVVAKVVWRASADRPPLDVELVGFFAAIKKGDAK